MELKESRVESDAVNPGAIVVENGPVQYIGNLKEGESAKAVSCCTVSVNSSYDGKNFFPC